MKGEEIGRNTVVKSKCGCCVCRVSAGVVCRASVGVVYVKGKCGRCVCGSYAIMYYCVYLTLPTIVSTH